MPSEVHETHVKVCESLTFAEFSRANAQRCGEVFHPVDAWSPTDWMTCVAGEVGEAANLIKNMNRGEDVPLHQVAWELADAVTYIDLLARRLGINLGAALTEEFNLVSLRCASSGFLEPDVDTI